MDKANIDRWKKKYPFLEYILALEENMNTITELEFKERNIDETLLDKKTHYADCTYEQGLPFYRIYSSDPSMPDKEGPVMTYAVKGERVKKLGLEWQVVDKEYIADGYNAEARLKPVAISIREELSYKGLENPDYIVCRDKKYSYITFEIYRRAGDGI
ncbi:MAG: hypothetical protein ACP5OA_07345 [Candidatus Woesearchaeota archaeon]